MKFLLLAIFGLAAASPQMERAATTTTKTVSQCQAYPTPSATTFVPAPPAACKTITQNSLTYNLYAESCYHQVDFEENDRGNTIHSARSDVCGAANACASFAASNSSGYLGTGPDYAFAIYWHAADQSSDSAWVCYSFRPESSHPQKGYTPPPLDEARGDYAREAFAWYHPVK